MNHYVKALLLLGLSAIVGCNPVSGYIEIDRPSTPQKDTTQPIIPQPKDSINILGCVTCDGCGVKGVRVSDGFSIVETDSAGRYSMLSDKYHGYVFMTVPSGYDARQEGTIPQFFSFLKRGTDQRDTVDFELNKVDQSKYRMLFWGDIHLADRAVFKDILQFRVFADDVNELLKDSVKTYALTLGDMGWDRFWITNSYDLNSYLEEVNKDFGSALTLFHTMGNHDNDSGMQGDFYGEQTYKRILGPTYYSMDIGGIHYVVLDDIEYFNTNGTRSFSNYLVSNQTQWLEKDLKYVPESTPIFITVHAPILKETGEVSLKNGKYSVIPAVGKRPTIVVSGHYHVIYNAEYSNTFSECNSGAVCASWWVTKANEGIHLCTDGTPGGYRVMEVDASNWSWYYKGSETDRNFQFRSYDRNEICLSADVWCPKAKQEWKDEFEQAAGEYATESSDNYVLLNVWDYDPSWTISVKENDKALEVERMSGAKDPLYLVCYEAYEYNNGYGNSVYYPCSETSHIFKVKASSATSTLNISVTDRFGHTYSETMTRPKAFTVENYR